LAPRKRVHVIANLQARGLNDRGRRLDELRDLARGRATLHETASVGELVELMRGVIDDRPDLVVLAGGDGTFMSGVTAIAPHVGRGIWPRLGLLPLGTVGTVARNFGDRRPPHVLLDQWLRTPEDVRAIPRPTLRVRAEHDGAVEERVGFIAGTGLVARFFELYEAGGAGGVPLAGKIVARVFVESFAGGPYAARVLTPIPCELEVDGVRRPLAGVSLLCAAVVRDLGLGMKVCYRAGEEPDRFHLVASGLSPSRLGPRAPYVMMGRTIGGKDHVDELVQSFRVRFTGGPGPYVLDGDSFRADTFEVSAGPLIPIVGA
jgi:diacylglycerol kinase (ATP)